MPRTTERSIWGPLNLIGVAVVGLAVILVNRVHTGPIPSPAQDIRPAVTPIQHPLVPPMQRSVESPKEMPEKRRQVIEALKEQLTVLDNLCRQRIDGLKQRFDEQTAGVDSAVSEQAKLLQEHRRRTLEGMNQEYLIERKYIEQTPMTDEQRTAKMMQLNKNAELSIARLDRSLESQVLALKQQQAAARSRVQAERREALTRLQKEFDSAKAGMQAVIDDYDQGRIDSQEATRAYLKILKEMASP